MPKLKYLIGFIDLKTGTDDMFQSLDCRTEIRKAEKSEVTTQVLRGTKEVSYVRACEKLLQELLINEKVPYDPSFTRLLEDHRNILVIAQKADRVISFVCVQPETANNFFVGKKTAYLALSATSIEHKSLCPKLCRDLGKH
jgi:hypothetical protein